MILKEVDGKAYVKGGPECVGCKGKGRVVIVLIHGKPAPKTTCPVCHGTGVQAVQDWSDARKAEWLKENKSEGILTISPSRAGWGIFFMGYDYKEYPIPNPNGDDAWGEAEDFSAALTAAVIAVAKEAL